MKQFWLSLNLVPKKKYWYSFENCVDTWCSNWMFWLSGGCLCQETALNAIFGCSRFQKFNFDCLLHKLLNGSPTTENIINFVCPLWTKSSIMISGTQIMTLKQCSDVWALSRLKPTFLWKDQFELICHARLPKTNRFNSVMTNLVSKKFLRQNLDFCGSYFLWPLWNWGFGTNMESNAAVTLQFEHIAFTNYLFLKDLCICWWKI